MAPVRRAAGGEIEPSPHRVELDGQHIGAAGRSPELRVLLRRTRTHRNADKSGRFRWYNDYELPEQYGGGTLTMPLHGNDEDTRRKLNRTENLRPIAASDPDFARLYPRRSDAESINRDLDDTLYLRRAHTVGHARQLLNLIGFALVVNGVAVHRYARHRAPDRLAA